MSSPNVIVTSLELASECGFVSDRLNSLLTAVQLKAGVLAEQSNDRFTQNGLMEILEVAQRAAKYTARLRELSGAGLSG